MSKQRPMLEGMFLPPRCRTTRRFRVMVTSDGVEVLHEVEPRSGRFCYMRQWDYPLLGELAKRLAWLRGPKQ